MWQFEGDHFQLHRTPAGRRRSVTVHRQFGADTGGHHQSADAQLDHLHDGRPVQFGDQQLCGRKSGDLHHRPDSVHQQRGRFDQRQYGWLLIHRQSGDQTTLDQIEKQNREPSRSDCLHGRFEVWQLFDNRKS